MKLHETQPPQDQEYADQLWSLIPWYVNGSLPEEEATAVRRHAEHNPAFAAEIAHQRKVAKEVSTADPFDVPRARSWDTLRAQIDADTQARTPQARGRGWFGTGLNGGLIALVGTVSLACLVLVVQVGMPVNNGFETLTSGSETVLPTIKFQPVPGTDMEVLTALLEGQGATLTSGPTDQGVYTATVPEGSDIEAKAEALMALAEILFAAPETD